MNGKRKKDLGVIIAGILVILFSIILFVCSYYQPYFSFLYDLPQAILFRLRFIALLIFVIGLLLLIFRQQISKRFNNIFQNLLFFIIRTNKYYIFSIFFLIIIGTILRVVFIDHPLRYYEAINFLEHVREPVNDIISGFSIYNHQFNTLIIHLSYLIFGDAVEVLRLPSIISGILLIPSVFVLGSRMFNKKVGVISASFIAVVPVFLEFSVNSAGFSLATLLFAIIFIINLYSLENYNIYSVVWCSLFSSIMLFINLLNAYSLLIILIWLWLHSTKKNIRKSQVLKKILYYVLFTLAITFIFYVPSIKSLDISGTVNNYLSFFSTIFIKYSVFFGNHLTLIIIILIGISGFIFFLRRSRSKELFLIIPVFLPAFLLSFFISEDFLKNYLFTSLPYIIILCSAGFLYIFEYFLKKSKFWQPKTPMVFSAFIILIFILSVFTYSPLEDFDKNVVLDDADKITEALKESINPGDKILTDEETEPILRYWLYRNNIPEKHILGKLKPSEGLYIILNGNLKDDIQLVLEGSGKDLLLSSEENNPVLLHEFDSAKIFKFSDLDYQDKLIFDMSMIKEIEFMHAGILDDKDEIIIFGEQGARTFKRVTIPVDIKENTDYFITFEIKEVLDVSREIHFYFFGKNYNSEIPREEFLILPDEVNDEYNEYTWHYRTGVFPEETINKYFIIITKSDGIISIRDLKIYKLN